MSVYTVTLTGLTQEQFEAVRATCMSLDGGFNIEVVSHD